MCALCRDTAGQERFKTITTAYYRGAMVSTGSCRTSILLCSLCTFALTPFVFSLRPLTLWQGIILVYDITDEKSFENIQNWMKSIKEVSLFHSAVIIVSYINNSGVASLDSENHEVTEILKCV